MILQKARINNFRCIDDSTEIAIDDVTCLVGKNESGKTAILKALYRLKPADEKESFKLAIDYPKRIWKPNLPTPKEPVIVTHWELESSEVSKVANEYGKDVLKTPGIKISKGYDNTRYYDISVDEQKAVEHIISKYRLVFEEGSNVSSLEHLKNYLAGVSAPSQQHSEALNFINTRLKDGISKAVILELDNLLPTFLYFDQYTRLPGNVSITEFQDKKNRNVLTENDKIFIALMSLAGTDVETIVNAKTFEEFNSSMKAISNQISDQIFGYWTQNKHLEVELKFDSARPGDPAPFNSGYVFRTRINNKRHRADTSFDERSSGFVWFFSFLVWFQQLQQTYKENLFILLDEPGLTLHARAQSDLLKYFNEKLRPTYQIVYTTHSPFMIDTDNILSARTVEDVVQIDRRTREETLLGTKVSSKVLSSDPDTVSPLQNALDYELTQSLFIGKNNILVEGPSDYLYLKWFSKMLESSGRKGLDYRWTISIVGGIDKIPGYISLFQGNLLHVAALVDVQAGHKQKLDNVQKSLKEKHFFRATDFSAKKEADFEDVFGYAFYVSLINDAYRLQHGHEIDTTKISDSSDKRITLEVEEYFRTLPTHIQEFDHFFPAQHLYELKSTDNLKGVEDAIKAVEPLIAALNALL